MRIEYDDNGYPYYVDDGNENTYDTRTGKTYRPDGSVAVESAGTEVPPPAPDTTKSTVPPNDPNAVFNRTVALRKAYWKYLYRLPTQAEFNQAAFGKQGQLIPKADFDATVNSIPGSEAAIRANTENKDKWNDKPVPGGADFGESTGYDPRAQGGGGGGDGNGYNLEQLKAAWLTGSGGRYAPTRAGLAQFIADNKGPGGFAEGVTIGGSKMNKLWLGPVSTGTYLGDVIRGTDSSSPWYDWDDSTGDTPPPPPAPPPLRPPPTIAPFIASGGGFPTFTPPSPLQLPDPFTYPDYVAPDKFAYDAYTLAQPFSYEAFQAPTGESIYSDPSYQFRLDQGAKALEASAANRGTLRTGGHLKNLEGYAQNFASQEYGNIYNRAAQQYGLNRTNAKDIYTTNEGNRASAYDTNYNTAKDIYGINAAGQLGSYNTNLANAKNAYQSKTDTANALYGSQYKTAQDQFDAQQKIAELQFGREWDAYKYANDDAYRYWNAQLGADTQKYGIDVNNL